MKKALLTLFLIGGVTSPAFAAANLVCGENFDATGSVKTSLAELVEGNSAALDAKLGTYTSSNLTALTVNSATDGFTIGFHMKHLGEASDMDTLCLSFSGVDRNGNAFTDSLRVEIQSGGNLNLWSNSDNKLGAGDRGLLDKVWGGQWYYIALTFKGDTLQASVVDTGYKQAVSCGSISLSTSNYSLTGITTGTDAPGENRMFLDNIAAYDGVLSAEEIEYLNTHAAPSSFPVGEAVPEPATATLSLLALAGLAARRRRK